MKLLQRFTAIAVFCFIFFSLSSQAAFAQDFSSLDSDLQLLEDLILDTIANTQEQQILLQDLKMSLDESGILISNYEIIITEQENLLRDLQLRLNEMSEIYQMQSTLSARSDQRLKLWRNFTLIGIPVTAVISGVIVWAVMR